MAKVRDSLVADGGRDSFDEADGGLVLGNYAMDMRTMSVGGNRERRNSDFDSHGSGEGVLGEVIKKGVRKVSDAIIDAIEGTSSPSKTEEEEGEKGTEGEMRGILGDETETEDEMGFGDEEDDDEESDREGGRGSEVGVRKRTWTGEGRRSDPT